MDFLSDRIEQHEREFDEELESVRSFLDSREFYTNVEHSYTESPEASVSDVTLNPLWPKFASRHEARHVGQMNTIRRLGVDFKEEGKDFYENELKDLNISFNTSGILKRINNLVDSDSNIDKIKSREERLDELNGRETFSLIDDKNYLTSEQQEVWASGGYLVPRMVMAVGAGVYIGDKPENIIDNTDYFTEVLEIWSQTKEIPESPIYPVATNEQMAFLTALGIGYAAVNVAAYGGAGIQIYDTVKAEPLTESSLEDLSYNDRKRAMLYNDNVADNIDDFLAVLDSYGIESKKMG